MSDEQAATLSRGISEATRVTFGRPLPPSILLVAIVVVVLGHFLLPLTRYLWYPANLVGLIPLGLGVYLNLAADGLLKRHHTTVKPFQQTAVLVTTGVYSRSRNPMYLGFVLIMLGLALLLGSVGPLVIVVILPGLLNTTYIRSEEAMLRARFGDQWLAYQGSVRKWF